MEIGITRTIVWLRKQTPSARAEFARELREAEEDAKFEEFKAHFNSEWDLGELICKTLMRNGVSEEILFKVVDALPADRKTVADGFESTIFERS